MFFLRLFQLSLTTRFILISLQDLHAFIYRFCLFFLLICRRRGWSRLGSWGRWCGWLSRRSWSCSRCLDLASLGSWSRRWWCCSRLLACLSLFDLSLCFLFLSLDCLVLSLLLCSFGCLKFGSVSLWASSGFQISQGIFGFFSIGFSLNSRTHSFVLCL